jgi:protein involved in polysaccharide export with SLBB domain
MARVSPVLVTFAILAGYEPASPSQVPEERGDSPLYILKRGDQLTVKVFGRPELEETLQIRPDGMISVQLLDDVPAAGRTPSELDALLTERYAEFFRDPEVTIIVRSFSGNQIYVGGEVERPGAIPLVGDLTALTAVLYAGGFKGTARTDSVILLRDGGDQKAIVRRLDLKAVLNDGQQDELLAPYDVIYVPMSRIAKVDKFVDEYIRKLLPITLTAGFQYITGSSVVVAPQ